MPTESLLSLADVARLEERRVAVGISEIASECRPFGGGMAARDRPGNFTNAAVGAGHDGPVSLDEVRDLVRWYADVGIEPRIEVSPYAHPTLVEHLGAEGFRVRFFENVFVRELSPNVAIEPPSAAPPDLVLQRVDPTSESMIDAFARIVASLFTPDDVGAAEAHIPTVRRIAVHPRTTSIVAIRNGVIVGGGSVEFSGEHAGLFGLAVHREHRRQGIQQAMMAWRLRYAAAQGARFATISARPDVATERNARRMGFTVAYTKVVLVRPAPGLVAVIE